MFSGHATDFFIRRVVLGQESSILKNLLGNWCDFFLLAFFWLFWHLPKHCTGHLDQSMDGSDEAYTLQAESRCVQVCVIFCQKLTLQEFLGRLGRFQAEAKMRRLLGKVGRVSSGSKENNFLGKLKRFSARNLKCAGFWKNRARIGQKIQKTDFKANSGGFRSETKMFRFFAQTRAIFGQKFECADFGTKLGIFLVKFLRKVEFGWNFRTVRTMVFFRMDFRTFRTFSHDFRTTCFLKVFFRTDFRTFRTVSHDFRTTCFFKAFCSHDLRTQAVGQRVCARFDRNQHKSGENHSFRLAHPKIFEFLQRKTLTNWKWTHRNASVICTVDFVLKLKILETFWVFGWKTFWPT